MNSSYNNITNAPCAATIGSFDGVHLGHRHVLRQLISLSQSHGLGSLVVTFSNHPMQVLRPDATQPVLSTTTEKEALLRKTGVEHIRMLPFTNELAMMTAHDFMKEILCRQLNVRMLLMGYDNHLGHDRKRFEDCKAYGKEIGIDVVVCDEWRQKDTVSSSCIRQALLEGDVEHANDLLGYCYTMQGIVVEGFQNGRKIGYPTANLQVPPEKLIPAGGAYHVDTPFGQGMLNIGTRPTLHNGQQRSIEVHILDFDGDLYGQQMQVRLLHRLRAEREFPTLDALQHQLQEDEKACRALNTHIYN